MNSKENELLNIFRDVLGNQEITTNCEKKNTESWDSIRNVFLFDKIQKSFNVEINTDDFLGCESFNDVLNLLNH